ncbi:MAG: CZB domain-containing protein [Bacteroidia bacterium]
MNTNTKLDFDQARIKHMLFKSKLRSILYGSSTDEQPILDETACPVGKWLYGHALDQYGHIGEMRKLEKVHQNIHNSARQLLDLYHSGKEAEAREGLSKINGIAEELVGLLNTIEQKMNV